MSEELIIEHCSPTLAGIKAGSMFSVRVTEDTDINNEVRELNKILRGKGLRVIPLKKTSRYALIYLYRPARLDKFTGLLYRLDRDKWQRNFRAGDKSRSK